MKDEPGCQFFSLFNALRIWRIAIVLLPTALSLSGEQTGDEHGKAADDNSEINRFNKTIADLNEAIRLNPDDAIAYFSRGIYFIGKGEFDKAVADCTEAIRLNPSYDAAYFGRGAAYQKKREFAKAIADYTEAIRLNPKFFWAYANRGGGIRDGGRVR